MSDVVSHFSFLSLEVTASPAQMLSLEVMIDDNYDDDGLLIRF